MTGSHTLGARVVAKNFMRQENSRGPLVVDERPGVVMLTLARPNELNSLNGELIEALHDQVEKAGSRNDIRVVCITGMGRAFSTGADLKEASGLLDRPAELHAWLGEWTDTLTAIEQCPKPVVAALNGLTVAAGLELALACDLIVASETARLGDGHATYGLVPAGGGSQRLPDAVGVRTARWLMYTAKLVSAQEALQLGLVQEVLPASDFDSAAWTFVSGIGAHSLPSLAFMKQLSRSRTDYAGAMDIARGPDGREGLSAFVEKRPPSFPSSGRGYS